MRLVRAPRVFHEAILEPDEILEFPEPLRGAVAVETEPAAPRDAYTGGSSARLVQYTRTYFIGTSIIDRDARRGGAWGYVSNDLPFTGVQVIGDAPLKVRVWAMEARVEDMPTAAIRVYRVLPTVPRDAIIERVYRVEFPGSGEWTKLMEIEPSFHIGASIISRKMMICEDCPSSVLVLRGRYWDDFHPRGGHILAPNVAFMDVGFAWHTLYARRAGHYRVRVIYALDVWPMEVVA